MNIFLLKMKVKFKQLIFKVKIHLGGVMWKREIASLNNKELDQVITNKSIVDSQFEEM